MEELVISRIEHGINTITLNRPDRLNTIDIKTLDALIGALDTADHNNEARVIVLTGAGKAFCAGADQAEMVPRKPAEWEAIVEHYLDPVRLICATRKPVIAKLQGDAVGGGLGLALASDYRIAARGIRLGVPFVKIGLAGCDMSAGYFLPRLVGLGKATDLMMSGRLADADEAERMGLIQQCVDPGELDAAVAELAAMLASGPPMALGFTKAAIRRSLDSTMNAEFDFEVFAQVQCLQSADHREGVAAFKEKRKPNFTGQ